MMKEGEEKLNTGNEKTSGKNDSKKLRLAEGANQKIGRLLRDKSYLDIPTALLPEDIKDIVEKRRSGKGISIKESIRLGAWFSLHQKEFVFGEREPIELGKYPEEIRELVRKKRQGGNLQGQESARLHQLMTSFFKTGMAEAEEVDEEAYEEKEEIFKHGALSAEELNDNFSHNESLVVVADFYKEVFKKDKWDKESLDSLKGYLIDKYPDSVEEIQVLGGFIRYLYKQQEINQERAGEYKYDPEVSRNFAEFNYLFCHFFVNLRQDRVYTQSLFSALASISSKLGFARFFGTTWQGNLGQVAIYKALSALDQKPEFSTPKEDVYYKVDLWAGRQEKESAAFQIKTSVARERTIVLQESELIDFPSVSKKLRYKERHFISRELAKINRYSAKVKEYGQETSRDIKAYYVFIPPSSIDYFTGELAPSALKKLREKVQSLDKAAEAAP